MFLDASALCAVLLDEPDRAHFEVKIASADQVVTSPIATWESMRAVMREHGVDARQATEDVDALLRAAEVSIVPISGDDYRAAAEAFARFGKGRHPAALNMGDCFSYACARSAELPLLYKGQDFALTDIVAA